MTKTLSEAELVAELVEAKRERDSAESSLAAPLTEEEVDAACAECWPFWGYISTDLKDSYFRRGMRAALSKFLQLRAEDKDNG
jgi:hypothetical protein